MSEQLSIFDTLKTENNDSLAYKELIVRPIQYKQQLNELKTVLKDEDNPKISQNGETELPYLYQKVKIKLPTSKDSEEYQYLKHYHSNLLSKVGVVEEITLYPSGKYTCSVNFFGEILLLHPEQLYLL